MAFSSKAFWSLALSCRRRAFSAARRRFSDLALKSPCVQFAASRNGWAIRFAAIWKGRRTDAAVLSTGSSALERKEAVRSASESTTRLTTTIRRLRGLERVGEWPEEAARWTEEPRTATRTFRLRGTSGGSLPTLLGESAPRGGPRPPEREQRHESEAAE